MILQVSFRKRKKKKDKKDKNLTMHICYCRNFNSDFLIKKFRKIFLKKQFKSFCCCGGVDLSSIQQRRK